MMYDDFSTEYDRFVNWSSRLAVEMPYLQGHLKDAGGHRILDTACGTGMHAIALQQAGFEMVGADVSFGMIEQARANSRAAGVNVEFKVAGFGEHSSAFGSGSFDAVLCLGNSLPHLLTADDVDRALVDFADCLRPGGLLVIQNRNFDAVMASRQRWMEPQSANEGDKEWLFLRFYDFEPDGLLTFNVISLHRQVGTSWTQVLRSTSLRPLLLKDMQASLLRAGFSSPSFFGDLKSTPFDPASSGNLVVFARLA